MGSSGFHLAWLVVLAAAPSTSAEHFCEPSPEIARAIGDALAVVPEGASVQERMAPVKGLRNRFERDLFVHLLYQDAIFEHGIEGHLTEMLEQYLRLQMEHGEDPLYLYLAGRAFEGRQTKRAIAMMEQVLALDSGFAPAHRTLAEIYGSGAFRDRKKERAARREFAAACPRSAIAKRPTPPPPHSTFFARLQETRLTPAEEEAIPAEVERALLQDEWRALRIRLFDWYSAGYKEQVLYELQVEHWQAGRVLVRHYRRTGRHARADELLADMEDRLVRLQRSRRAAHFSRAARTVLGLYAEAEQSQKLRTALVRLKQSLDEHPNPKRAAELKRVGALFGARL
jgi:hypothetical protein